MNKAVFLDRDGTINEDVGYIDHPQNVKLIQRSAEAIKLLNEAGFKVIVVSNQAGIARGIMSEDMLQTVDKKLQKEVLKGGGYIDEIFYCPHHPDHGVYPYKKECSCRKPGNEMIIKATKKYNISLNNSFMIGDKISDVEAGKKSGVKTILVLTGKGKDTIKNNGHIDPDYKAENLFSAVKWILNGSKND